MRQSHTAARAWLVAILVVALLLTPFTRVPHASAADASLVVAALHVLEQQYVEPVQPVALLNAAIATLRKATNGSASRSPDIAVGTPEREATTEFAADFSRAAQNSPSETTNSRIR